MHREGFLPCLAVRPGGLESAWNQVEDLGMDGTASTRILGAAGTAPGYAKASAWARTSGPEFDDLGKRTGS